MSARHEERSDRDALLAQETGDEGIAAMSNRLQPGITVQAALEATTIPDQGRPDNQAGLAWFSCLCCFWPLGVYALYKSYQAEDKWNAGDFEGARESSESARSASLLSIAFGAVIFVIIYLPKML